jgi:RNA polymerase sigma factor (sigma-70 family)
VPQSDATCWTMVARAAKGDETARSEFAQQYLSIVRAYLSARWRQGPMLKWYDDAVQDVFLECLRPEGPLARVKADGSGRFRSFLFAVVRNIARRYEERRDTTAEKSRGDSVLNIVQANDESIATAFDKAWAKAMLTRAGERHRAKAETEGPESLRRVKILKLRFGSNRPVREIAAELEMDVEVVHVEYRKARAEFKSALREEVLFHNPDSQATIEQECLKLLELLR